MIIFYLIFFYQTDKQKIIGMKKIPNHASYAMVTTIRFNLRFACSSTALRLFDDLRYDLLWAAALRPE